jgi:hypothetical protein
VAEISGDWVPAQKEREAAWEMYVELVTRGRLHQPDAG